MAALCLSRAGVGGKRTVEFDEWTNCRFDPKSLVRIVAKALGCEVDVSCDQFGDARGPVIYAFDGAVVVL